MNQVSTQAGITALVPHSTFRLNELHSMAIGTSGADYIVVGEAGANTRIHGGDGGDYIVGGKGNDLLSGGNGDDTIVAGDGDDVVVGGDGDDFLLGGAGNDLLCGNAGEDILFAEGGVNMIDGGTGNDKLLGGMGEDTFLFRRGDGVDKILIAPDEGGYTRDVTVVSFADLTADQLSTVNLREDLLGGRDLVMQYGDGDALTVLHQVSSAGNAISRFRFSDGTELDTCALLQKYSGTGGTLGSSAQQNAAAGAVLNFHLAASSVATGGESLMAERYASVLDTFLGVSQAGATEASAVA